MLSRRKALLAIALVVTVLGGAGSSARNADRRLFSEYIEGSSNNKALEIYNGTGGTVNLAAGGYTVQMFFNGSASAGLTIALTGTARYGRRVRPRSGYGQPDNSRPGRPDERCRLVQRQRRRRAAKGRPERPDRRRHRPDRLRPGRPVGLGLESTQDNTLRRKGSIEAGDTNGGDAFEPSV